MTEPSATPSVDHGEWLDLILSPKGDLSEAELQRTLGHLASCESCRRRAVRMDHFRTKAGQLLPQVQGDTLVDRVMTRIRVEESLSGARRRLAPLEWRRWLPWLSPIAATAAAAVVLAFLIGNREQPDVETMLLANGAGSFSEEPRGETEPQWIQAVLALP